MFPEWPYFEKDEIDAVVEVLKSGKVNYWTGVEVNALSMKYCLSGIKNAIVLFRFDRSSRFFSIMERIESGETE
jgi:dTDP-4-amino-4,6-dideoxygalactose transaminase